MTEAKDIIARLRKHNLHIATAESCTGGLLAGAITEIPKASEVFDCGIISYSNEIKSSLLGVDEAILATYGAVSEETAKALAMGMLKLAHADLALATTGIAGPGGGSREKPVGLVYIALADLGECMVEKYTFQGSRSEIRCQTVSHALEMAEKYLSQRNL